MERDRSEKGKEIKRKDDIISGYAQEIRQLSDVFYFIIKLCQEVRTFKDKYEREKLSHDRLKVELEKTTKERAEQTKESEQIERKAVEAMIQKKEIENRTNGP